MLWVVAVLLLAPVLILAGLSLASRNPPALGVKQGRLLPCSGASSCVSSETPGSAAIAPLPAGQSPARSWAAAREAVRQAGGSIIAEEPGYLRAAFATPLWRFIDDLELRLDEQQGVIHIRSASRVGRSDFGANRKRVAEIASLYCRDSAGPCP